MNENVKIFFGLIGGLALFLYGMNSMSDALQKTAGEKMKKILGFLTKNPIMGALAGALVTAVLQSSSATTVMTIGFVSAGLMSLPQAISVIFGANIGTTMTAQLMAFKISDYIYPIIFVGFMMNFVSKNERIKNIGLAIFSFGLLFEGIEIMGTVMKPLASSPFFLDLMDKVKDIPILGLFLGAGMTLVVQSSSATIAVLQNFASQVGADGVHSVIGLAGAIPILLGDNIGTTITALLASIGQNKNAKRTAISHSIFNITGSIVFMMIIPLFTKVVMFISPKGNEVDIISRQIANAHTLFNVVCTLVWLPLIGLMVKIVTTIIPDGKEQAPTAGQTQYLDEHVMDQPLVAMYLVSEESVRLGQSTVEVLENLKSALQHGKDSEEYKEFHRKRKQIHDLQAQIADYITKMFSNGNITEQQAEQLAGYLYVTNNLERISDRCRDIDHILKETHAANKSFSLIASEQMDNTVDRVTDLLKKAMNAIQTGDRDSAKEVIMIRNVLRNEERKYHKQHLERVKSKACDPSLQVSYSTLLDNLERMADACACIAEEAKNHIQLLQLDPDHSSTNVQTQTA